MNMRKTAGLIIGVVLVAASLTYVFANRSQPGFHGVGVLKSADPFAYVGDMVTYVIRVFNPSDLDLHSINVTDAMLDLDETIPFMAAGNTTGVTYALQREVLEADPNPLINTVSVEALDEQGIYSTASTQATTTIAQRLIDIEKTGPEFAHEGDTVKYSIVITNLADSPIVNVKLTDEMLGFSWKGDLAVGEVNIFNLTYVVPRGAEDPLINIATVTAKLDETVIYAEDSWTVDILPKFYPRSMGYWKNHPEAWPVNEIKIGDITYSKEQALEILTQANARDATRMLAAQLIAAKLNRLSKASPFFKYFDETIDIDDVIENADSFLATHPIGSDPQGDARQQALQLKDILDAYNNNGECD